MTHSSLSDFKRGGSVCVCVCVCVADWRPLWGCTGGQLDWSAGMLQQVVSINVTPGPTVG